MLPACARHQGRHGVGAAASSERRTDIVVEERIDDPLHINCSNRNGLLRTRSFLVWNDVTGTC